MGQEFKVRLKNLLEEIKGDVINMIQEQGN